MQRNYTSAWPFVSELLPWIRLGITVFFILALPRVTLGIIAKEVKQTAETSNGDCLHELFLLSMVCHQCSVIAIVVVIIL